MGRTIVNQLGLRTVPLKTPIRFEQIDGSLLGRVTRLVTEPVELHIAEHKEVLRFSRSGTYDRTTDFGFLLA